MIYVVLQILVWPDIESILDTKHLYWNAACFRTEALFVLHSLSDGWRQAIQICKKILEYLAQDMAYLIFQKISWPKISSFHKKKELSVCYNADFLHICFSDGQFICLIVYLSASIFPYLPIASLLWTVCVIESFLNKSLCPSLVRT